VSLLVTCARCGASYARVLLDPSREGRCRCGAPLDVRGSAPRFVDREALQAEETKLRELSRAADRLAFLIVATDCPRVDIDIQRVELRRRCRTLFPDKMELFEMIYESRFKRLWEQFRAEQRSR
jgi:hypothetical protein